MLGIAGQTWAMADAMRETASVTAAVLMSCSCRTVPPASRGAAYTPKEWWAATQVTASDRVEHSMQRLSRACPAGRVPSGLLQL